MKIAILIQNTEDIDHDRFLKVGADRGHKIVTVHLAYCYMNISTHTPLVYYRSNELFKKIDAILPRFKIKESIYGTAVLRQFERMGFYTLNSALSLSWAQDKLRTLQQMAKNKLPMPVAGFAEAPKETEKLIEIVGGAPLVIKLLESKDGKSTIFAETYQAAVSVINAFKQLNTHLLIQEYISEAKGNDIRCMVVGNEVVIAIQRAPKEFKEIGLHKKIQEDKKLHRKNHVVEITPLERKMAILAAKAMKLKFATVDLIRANRGPLILDIDASPNIEWLEKISGTDIVTPIFEFMENGNRRIRNEKS